MKYSQKLFDLITDPAYNDANHPRHRDALRQAEELLRQSIPKNPKRAEGGSYLP